MVQDKDFTGAQMNEKNNDNVDNDNETKFIPFKGLPFIMRLCHSNHFGG